MADALAANGYAKAFDTLVDAQSNKDVNRAISVLVAAGIEAFPSLLAHLNDKRPTKETWLGESEERMTPDGKWYFTRSTVGETCFDILHRSIEGFWQPPYQHFYTITPDNVKQWVEAHNGETREQMAESARKESLRRAEAEFALHPEDVDVKGAVDFLRARRYPRDFNSGKAGSGLNGHGKPSGVKAGSDL